MVTSEVAVTELEEDDVVPYRGGVLLEHPGDVDVGAVRVLGRGGGRREKRLRAVCRGPWVWVGRWMGGSSRVWVGGWERCVYLFCFCLSML